MSQQKRKKTTQVGEPAIIRQTYRDEDEIPRVVLVPKGEDAGTGIPISLDLSPLYGHMPAPFLRSLYTALHEQGLIEPGDYFKKGAAERFQAAMRTVLRHDFLDVQTLADKEIKHG